MNSIVVGKNVAESFTLLTLLKKFALMLRYWLGCYGE